MNLGKIIASLENLEEPVQVDPVEEQILDTEIIDNESKVTESENLIDAVDSGLQQADNASETISEITDVIGDEEPTETMMVVTEHLLSSIHTNLGFSYTPENFKNSKTLVASLEERNKTFLSDIIDGIKYLIKLITDFVQNILQNTALLRRKAESMLKHIESLPEWGNGGKVESNIDSFQTVGKIQEHSFDLIVVASAINKKYEELVDKIKTGKLTKDETEDMITVTSRDAFTVGPSKNLADADLRLFGVDFTEQLYKHSLTEKEYDHSNKQTTEALSKRECIESLKIAIKIINNLQEMKKISFSFKNTSESLLGFLNHHFKISYSSKDKDDDKDISLGTQRAFLRQTRLYAKYLTKSATKETISMFNNILTYVKVSSSTQST